MEDYKNENNSESFEAEVNKPDLEQNMNNNDADLFGDELSEDSFTAEEEFGFEENSDMNFEERYEANPNFSSSFEEIKFSPVNPYEKKPMSRGLKVFSLVLVAVILLSAACCGGYFMGKNSNLYGKNQTSVGLEAKPQKSDELTAAQVYEKVNKSVVGISVYNEKGLVSGASGVIYSKDGYLVTNDHIYSEIAAPKFKIHTYDGKEYSAEYVAGDTISDLAVLKIKGGSFTPATFGNSSDIIFGESVVAVGRPNDPTDKSSISKGIISAVSKRVQTTSNYSASLIQTDSAINPGSSGGALVNMYGQVIGITSAKLAGVEYDAVGFAIPTVMMKRVVEQLISDGGVKDRAKLGISYTAIDSITAEVKGYSATGLGIVSVSEDSDLYGKVNAGDIITHVNGNEIKSDEFVLDFIENSKAGDTATFTVLFAKSNRSKDFTVKFKSNVGQSSYQKADNSSDNSDKTFDFPNGE